MVRSADIFYSEEEPHESGLGVLKGGSEVTRHPVDRSSVRRYAILSF